MVFFRWSNNKTTDDSNDAMFQKLEKRVNVNKQDFFQVPFDIMMKKSR